MVVNDRSKKLAVSAPATIQEKDLRRLARWLEIHALYREPRLDYEQAWFTAAALMYDLWI